MNIYIHPVTVNDMSAGYKLATTYMIGVSTTNRGEDMAFAMEVGESFLPCNGRFLRKAERDRWLVRLLESSTDNVTYDRGVLVTRRNESP